MNILSIDVGIKNLAYCLFFIQSKEKYEISQWHVIDLTTSKKKCCGIKKDLTICNKNAQFFKKNDYYCKIHAKKKNYLIPTVDLLKIEKHKISTLKKLCNKFKIPFNKKQFKKADYCKVLNEYINNHFFSVISRKNANTINIISLGRIIKQKFDSLLQNIHIDTVIIEHQVGPIANRMKMLQGMIIQHFIEKNIVNIKEISPINKLKDFLGEKSSYNERKKLGIKVCTNLISSNLYFNVWLEFFLSQKKKDDLSDCFLQGHWYLKYNNCV